MKRDRVYEVVLAIVLISLGLGTGRFLTAILTNTGDSRSWFALIANAVAIFGTFWLLKDYLRRLKEANVKTPTKKT